MARGTRFSKSKAGISGTTFATIPSGVTIGPNGANILSYTASGYKVSGGNTAWAGTTLSLVHGFTDLKGLSYAHYNTSGASVTKLEIEKPSPVPGSVSACLVAVNQVGGSSTAMSGGTLFWVAFGN